MYIMGILNPSPTNGIFLGVPPKKLANKILNLLTTSPYLKDHPITDRYVVNDHGHCKSPKDRVVGPLPIGLFMASKWGVANHVLTGMILQVTPVTRLFPAIYRRSNSIIF